MGVELDNLALAVEQVLGEVPCDIAVGRLLLQVLVDWRGILTVDFNLTHERETDLPGRGDPLKDLSLGLGLLRTKLVARECQYAQTIA